MKDSDTLQETTIEDPSQNLYLLVSDSTGNPIGLVPTTPPVSLVPFSRLPNLHAHRPRQPHQTPVRQMPTRSTDDQILLPLVESALKRLDDVVFLSDHPLVQLRCVETNLQRWTKPSTALQRGKALAKLMLDAIEELRPTGPIPTRTTIPNRGWHPYLLLYSCYVQDEKNASIMAWLQIGEGTFNRTRRKALQALTMTILEWEGHAAASV